MNELRELKAMRADVPPPTTESLRSMRGRLTRETTPGKRRVAPRLPAFVWRTAAVCGLAAAVLLGVTVAHDSDLTTRDVASADEHLRNAATVVASQPASITERPRPGQWAYVKYFLPDRPGSKCQGNCMVHLGSGKDPQEVRVRARWLRIDGQRDAYELQGSDQLFVQAFVEDEYGGPHPAQLWDYYQSMPRDPDALLEAIYAEVRRIEQREPGTIDLEGGGIHVGAVWLIGTMLGAEGLTPPPDLHAALFEALAKVPGVRVEDGVKDVAGRDAIFVGRAGEFGPSQTAGFFLDPTDYTYLGGTENYQGEDTEGWAILDRGIVDQAGDRP